MNLTEEGKWGKGKGKKDNSMQLNQFGRPSKAILDCQRHLGKSIEVRFGERDGISVPVIYTSSRHMGSQEEKVNRRSNSERRIHSTLRLDWKHPFEKWHINVPNK